MKLKDYAIPQYGPGDGQAQEDLEQYSLKNFDLKAYQRSQKQPDPEPIPSPRPVAAAPQAPSPDQLVQTELNPPALEPYDVQFGAHFNLQTVSYSPLSPAQSWKIPRWVVGMVGLFFGSAAVLTLAFCVVLLRDPKAAPTEPLAAPTPPAATTSAAPAQAGSSSPTNKPPGDVARAASAPNPMHDDPAAHRIVVSRHPSVVRRPIYGPRRVAATSTSSSVAPQETETASRRPPQDALDKLLSESTL